MASAHRECDPGTLRRIRGTTQRSTVNRDSADRQAATVLDLTAGHHFRALKPQYLPAGPCCDRFRYDIVVLYRNGAIKAITAGDGAPQPQRC